MAVVERGSARAINSMITWTGERQKTKHASFAVPCSASYRKVAIALICALLRPLSQATFPPALFA